MVRFAIGPVPSGLARPWIANGKRLIDAVRSHRWSVHIEVHEDVLDLCELLLDVWAAHAEQHETFNWSRDADAKQLVMVVRQWLAIGTLTDDELAAIGCTWAPDWTRPFSDAVVSGAIDALGHAGPEGAALVTRLRADETVS